MKISVTANHFSEDRVVLLKNKINTDEEIVRHELARVWIKMLEKYARPGAAIPPAWAVRQEIIQKGVDAAVSAICDEHWFVFSWMVESEVREKVERELAGFDLERFIADVKLAQHDPKMLNHLRDEIRHYVLARG